MTSQADLMRSEERVPHQAGVQDNGSLKHSILGIVKILRSAPERVNLRDSIGSTPNIQFGQRKVRRVRRLSLTILLIAPARRSVAKDKKHEETILVKA